MTKGDSKRIQVLEDVEAIKKLKASYCYWTDAGVAGDASQIDELIAHFTDDEPWVDFGLLGVHKGKEAVAAFLKEVVVPGLSYSAHMVSNPIIDVDGSEAAGKWYVDCPCTLRDSEAPIWLQAKYEERYVKEGEVWKWKCITATFDFITPFDEGWAKTRMITLE